MPFAGSLGGQGVTGVIGVADAWSLRSEREILQSRRSRAAVAMAIARIPSAVGTHSIHPGGMPGQVPGSGVRPPASGVWWFADREHVRPPSTLEQRYDMCRKEIDLRHDRAGELHREWVGIQSVVDGQRSPGRRRCLEDQPIEAVEMIDAGTRVGPSPAAASRGALAVCSARRATLGLNPALAQALSSNSARP